MTEERGYYAIVSRLNGLALDIEGSSSNPGAFVIPWDKHLADNQLWYDDPINGTIRSKLNSFCLDVEGVRLQVRPHQPGNTNQLWTRDAGGGYIRNRIEANKVLDIFGKRTEPGAPVGVYDENGGVNQQWDFLFVGGSSPPVHKRCFCIVSEMNRKVLDITGGSSEPGAKVITWSKGDPPTPSQLWYTDYHGCIYSALTGFVFEAKETGNSLKMVPPTNNIKQFWTLADNKKIWNKNGTGECMDIAKEKDDNGAKVISYHYRGSSNQNWSFEYV